MIRSCKDKSCQAYIDNLIKINEELRAENIALSEKKNFKSMVIEQGYRPTSKLDTKNPPKSGSGVLYPGAAELAG